MYTQCPECGVAFRVTAEVLKMAAGKVRCGGCGVAFNALEHLSESKPAPVAQQEDTPDPDVSQLNPDVEPELEAGTPPESISAEQSAALLQTLDELANEDIRLEDTGAEPEEHVAHEAVPEPGADEPSQVIDEMLFDDNTVLPDDFDAVVEAPSPSKPVEPLSAEEPGIEMPQIDLDLSQPDEWDDLLGDLEELRSDIDEPEPEVDVEAVNPPDMDTQFAIQAEAMGIDVSGYHEAPQEHEEAEPEVLEEPATEEAPAEFVDIESSIEEDLIAAAFETEAAAEPAPEIELDEEPAFEDEKDIDENIAIDLHLEDEIETEDDVDDIARSFDDKVEEDIATLSMSMDEEPGEEADITAEADDDQSAVPEMSEEEKTINMMIDEELLSIAVEDEDGFASTIVQVQPDDRVEQEIAAKDLGKKKKDKKEKKKKKKDKDKRKDKDKKKDKVPQLAVETIIMEGEFVRAEMDKESLADDEAVPDAPAPTLSIPLNREKDDYQRRREMTSAPPGAGMYAGIAGLVLLLALQAVHQSREALATVPAFNSAVGPVYRLLGQPLTPTWNISGWRFEATKGDTDEAGDALTIYSRVGNNADEPLPYPLVHLSLTDRFEDIIGSALLEPAEYLPENADPRKLVPPGNTFNAVISIESPSPDATGFKLNVCYRLSGNQLRCADHDFK